MSFCPPRYTEHTETDCLHLHIRAYIRKATIWSGKSLHKDQHHCPSYRVRPYWYMTSLKTGLDRPMWGVTVCASMVSSFVFTWQHAVMTSNVLLQVEVPSERRAGVQFCYSSCIEATLYFYPSFKKFRQEKKNYYCKNNFFIYFFTKTHLMSMWKLISTK